MSTAPEIIDIPYMADGTGYFSKIRHLPNPIWLDSGKPRSLQGRFDIMSASPLCLLETHGDKTVVTNESGATSTHVDSPFALAQSVLQDMGEMTKDYAHLPFVGGLMGFFGYGLGLPDHKHAPPTSQQAMPDMRLGWYGWSLTVNHQHRWSKLIFHPRCPLALRQQVKALIQADVAPPTDSFRLTDKFLPSLSEKNYYQAIEQIQSYIKAGDCYQVNFAHPYKARYEGDLWLAYQRLRQQLPSPYGAYMAWGDKGILSCSPERFLKVSLGQVESKPIKGTISRGNTVEEDEQNAIALMNSTKDRAENLMIVDLLRNDLGKSCQPGSIRVPKLFALESFANVHHLVSTVTGTLAPNQSALSLLENAFPGGSITGAPKKRAMEIISELEPLNRGAYCGCIGYISATGRMDTNIAIRTVQASGGQLTCWGGGGIVSDSIPTLEYQESQQKIRILLQTLEGVFS